MSNFILYAFSTNIELLWTIYFITLQTRIIMYYTSAWFVQSIFLILSNGLKIRHENRIIIYCGCFLYIWF